MGRRFFKGQAGGAFSLLLVSLFSSSLGLNKNDTLWRVWLGIFFGMGFWAEEETKLAFLACSNSIIRTARKETCMHAELA